MAGLNFPVAVIISAVDRFSGPLARMGGSAAKLGANMKAVGRGLTIGVTLPLAALGAAAASTGLDVERSLAVVEARTRATAEEMAAVNSEVDRLGEAPHTISQAAKAAELLALKGESAASITQLLGSVLLFAGASGLELADSVEVTTDVLEAYGLEASESARVTDVLAVAAGRADLAALAEGIQAVGTRARTMGQPLETSVALLAELAQVNLEGAEGAKVMGRALDALRKPSADAGSVLRRLGVARGEVFADDGRPRDLLDVLAALERRGASATDVYRVFGRTAGPGMAALLERGTAGARAFREELAGGAGRALELQQAQLRGASGGLAEFRAGWDRLKVSIARSGLLEALGEGARRLGEFVSWLSRADPRLLKVASVLAVLAAALGPVLVAVGTGAVVFGSLATVATALAVPLGTVVLVAGGIGLAIAAVVAAGVLLLTHWDEVKRGAAVVWDYVSSKVTSALDWIGDRLSSVASLVPDWLVDLLGGGSTTDLAAAAAAPATSSPALRDRAARAGAAAAGGPARADVSGRVVVDFAGVPRGTRITTQSSGDLPLDVEAGYNLAGGI